MPEAIFKYREQDQSMEILCPAAQEHGFPESPSSSMPALRNLLASYTELLNIVSDLEEKLRGQDIFGMSYIRSQSTRAVFHTLRMVKSLDDLSGTELSHSSLTCWNGSTRPYKRNWERERNCRFANGCCLIPESPRDMVDWVGGKNANLGELVNKAGLAIPEGFAITTCAYDFFLEQNALVDEINRIANGP